MLLQMLSRSGADADDTMRDVPKDPRNQQAVSVLCLALLPLALQFINGKPVAWMAMVAGIAGLFAIAIWLISTGLQQGADYAEARMAKAPRLPRRILGALLLGVGIAALGALRGATFDQIVFRAVLTTVLAMLSFGIDPLRDKGLDTVEDRDQFRAGSVSDAAQSRMQAMSTKIATLRDAELDALMTGFGAVLTRMLTIMQDDPARIRALRVHLGVYLDGAEEATNRFVALYRGTQDEQARSDYMMLLCDLADEFEHRGTQYAMDGKSKLDVQIDVLRHKMGVHTR